ncbi:TAXI family TRAP transporter solute-binding subunit [Arthrobacter castelli]|uniref:TAXI family TRAP transporter solute-binding subunit n=1 Tax=Arthrobacter castelli TaxID=271431 RepID=UPI0004143BDD|nr:TAXI family TRAP transporter solute-binding subunit [Arthrobacter castelli]
MAAAALAVPALFLTACGGGGGGGEAGGNGGGGGGGGNSLSIATGGTGGVYYPLGGGIATVISKNVKGTQATVQETNASVDNMLLVQDGAADLALGVGDVVAAATAGTNSFEGKPLDICAVGAMYHNYMQPVTAKGSGIDSVEDMKGKTISVGAPGSATEVGAKRVLKAAGIDPKTDIDRRQLGVAETVAALRDGTIDAGFWSGGLPTGALVDLASTGDMKMVEIGEYADELAKEYGKYYVKRDVPANTYKGQSEPKTVIASPNILVANKSMDKQLQQDITKAIFEHKDALVKVHSAAKELDASTAGDVPFADICPGSQAYYESAG